MRVVGMLIALFSVGAFVGQVGHKLGISEWYILPACVGVGWIIGELLRRD